MGKGLEKLDEAMKQMTLQTAIIQQCYIKVLDNFKGRLDPLS